MSQVIDGKFACGGCGKRYTWKPELAGKSAKCKCGTVFKVPAALPAKAKPKPVVEEDVYDIADAPPEPKAMPPRPAGAAIAEAPVARTLAYQSAPTEKQIRAARESAEKLVDRRRDFHAPIAILAAGFVAFLLWGLTQASTGEGALLGAVVMIYSFVATFIKTVALIGLALVAAPMMGISFGGFWTAVLKFAAIIVFTDAALLWLDTAMEHMGAMPQSGRNVGRVLIIQLVATAAVISVLSMYLFDMDSEETGKFAGPFAIASFVIGWILNFLIAVMLG